MSIITRGGSEVRTITRRESWKRLLLADHLDISFEMFLNSKHVFISTLQTEKENSMMSMKSM
jgi:hypothetical protein